MPLHANPVAQNGSASERTRWIDCDDADRFLFGAIEGRKAVHQRAFPGSGSARDPDPIRMTGVGKKQLEKLFGIRRAIFNSRNGA
jgi:hypothetical protein